MDSGDQADTGRPGAATCVESVICDEDCKRILELLTAQKSVELIQENYYNQKLYTAVQLHGLIR